MPVFSFKNIFRKAHKNYEELSRNFKEGDIIYGLSMDRTVGLMSLNQVHFPSHINGKENILVQNTLTNAVFGTSVTPGKYRTNLEIQKDLHDGRRGVLFKNYTVTYPPLQKSDYLSLNGYDRANKLWKRTSKAGLLYQIFQRNKQVHFCVDNTLSALEKVAKKEGIEGTCVTASEIRLLYRYRGNAKVRRLLKIYVKDREIPIDQFFNHPSWAYYSPKETYS
ncbi:hypothetical protein M9194_07220 [Vibrio sp. S4M6]|uniref:hypothetical protein n=1 Tax=Vibrio sinus TaxID=2946865 RepID=UPI00202A1E4F|nr:hypothetical protein [Vibrio sinus]MCL9781216.1 hypothetical protein [Vibrio sinus]